MGAGRCPPIPGHLQSAHYSTQQSALVWPSRCAVACPSQTVISSCRLPLYVLLQVLQWHIRILRIPPQRCTAAAAYHCSKKHAHSSICNAGQTASVSCRHMQNMEINHFGLPVQIHARSPDRSCALSRLHHALLKTRIAVQTLEHWAA